MTVHVHENDLPAEVRFQDAVAVDTETMGLLTPRDRLCVVQLSAGDGDAHLVRIAKGQKDAPNLRAVIEDETVLKIFHFGRFDVAALHHWLAMDCRPVWCTKIASRLVRTYTDRHGLKELCRELIEVDISKQQQSSDWGADVLSQAQREYAAQDVLHLHRLRDALTAMLAREGRLELAQACFDFLPVRARLDVAGWAETDIFAHS